MALADVLPEWIVRQVDDAFFGSDWHFVTLEELEETHRTDLGKGLSMAVASDKMDAVGPNVIPSPQPCPAWMCCLLPWLKNTPMMQSYRRCLAESAMTTRNGKCICIDPSSLVPGDVVYVEEGDIIPADCRVLECTEELILSPFDTACEFKLHAFPEVGSARESFLHSHNILFAGTRVDRGHARALVLNIGRDTLMATLIEKKLWPIDGFFRTKEDQPLLPVNLA